MNITRKKIVLWVLFLFICFGCTPYKTPEQLLSSAQKHIQEKDQSSAIIELKNVISLEPKNTKARIMLGNVYLSSGDGVKAQKEFEKAEQYQADPNEFYPALARSFYLQYLAEDILHLDLTYLNIQESKNAVLFYKGVAAYQIGELQQAEDLFNESKSLNPYSVFGMLSEAHLNILQKNATVAMKIVNDILVDNPGNLEAIFVKARLSLNLQYYPEAINILLQYSELQPNDLQSLLILASAYAKNLEYKKAESISDKLLKIAPNSALLNQIKGVARYYEQDFELASRHLNIAIQNNYTTTETLFLAGAAEFQLKNFEQSFTHLKQIESLLPKNHPAKKILALIRIKLGYNNESGTGFADLEDLSTEDAALLNGASYELLKDGDISAASKLLEQSISLKSDKPDDMIRQGMLRLSMKDIEGIVDLERALDLEPNSEVGKKVLANAYIINKQYDKALELAEKWQKNNDIAGYNLAGTIYNKLNQIDNAKIAFTSALSHDENNTPSLVFFINQAIKNKKTAEALNHVNALLKAHPDFLPAFRLNYLVHVQNGNTQAALNAIKQFVEKEPDNINARLLYTQFLIAEKQPNKVIELLTDSNIKNQNIDIPYYWLALGDSYLSIREHQKGLDTFNAWIEIKPTQREPWLRIVSIYESEKNYPLALETIKKALTHIKNDIAFNIIEISLLIKNGDFNEAEINLNTYVSKDDNNPFIQNLRGRILLNKNEYKEALPKLLAYYESRPSDGSIGYVYSSYLGMQQENNADQFLIQHINKFPQDTLALALLANSKFDKSPDDAIRLYKSILLLAPSNLLALNNLAFLTAQKNLLDEAASIADKGLAQHPNSAVLLDTAASIYEKLGNFTKAKDFIERAYALEPENSTIERNLNRIRKL